MVLTTDDYVKVRDKHASGEWLLPKRSVLRSSQVKLDIMLSLYLRANVSTHTGDRYLMSDAYRQSHVNIFVHSDDFISVPKGSDYRGSNGIGLARSYDQPQFAIEYSWLWCC